MSSQIMFSAGPVARVRTHVSAARLPANTTQEHMHIATDNNATKEFHNGP